MSINSDLRVKKPKPTHLQARLISEVDDLRCQFQSKRRYKEKEKRD